MKRTWPCERTKNSRSGTSSAGSPGERQRLSFSSGPRLSRPAFARGYRRLEAASNLRINLSGESNLNVTVDGSANILAGRPEPNGLRRFESVGARMPLTARRAGGMGRRMSTQPQPLTNNETLVAELARAGRAAQRHLARMMPTPRRPRCGRPRARCAPPRHKFSKRTPGILPRARRTASAGHARPAEARDARLEAIAAAIEQVAALPDPVGQVIDRSLAPNGLELTRVRMPIGVIGIIYESRPNVTADAGALCLQVRQRGDPARRLARAVASRRARSTPRCVDGLRGGRPAGRRDPAGADHDRAAVGAMLAS